MALDIDTDAPPLQQSETKAKDGTTKPSLKYWRAQWAASEKARDRWMQDSRAAWDEFLAGRSVDKGSTKETAARYPIYWSAIRTIQPAVYARTPIPVTEKAFDTMKDDVGRLAGICSERLAKFLVRACPYDRVMKSTRDDFLHTAKATCRVFFEADLGPETERVNYNEHAAIGETGEPSIEYRNDAGEPFEGDELQQDDEGFYDEQPRTEFTPEELGSINCGVIPVAYADYLHTPNARNWEELKWIRFRNPMTRKECKKRFGDVALDFKYSSLTDEKNKKDVERTLPTQFAFIGETWDKETGQVYWDCEGYETDFIETKKDPYNLRGFFPCVPFMLGSIGPDHLYPTPDFIQLRPFIDQLHGAADRLRILVLAARVMGVYDGSYDELNVLESLSGDAVFISVGKMKKLIADGGLEGLVQFFPIEKISAAISELQGLIEKFDALVYQLWGIPDLLRGVSDYRETAEAQQKKGEYVSQLFADIQREFQRVNRDAIELMQDLALKKMPEPKLQAIMGFQFMDPQTEQPLWPQVLQLLQNDQDRLIRIDIETDSTIIMNQNQEIEQKNYLAKTLLDGLASVAQASQQDPTFQLVALQVVALTVRGLQKGKDIEQEIDQLIDQLKQKLSQPPPPPAPDPKIQVEQMKQQGKMQELQTHGQLKQQELQGKAQLEQMKLQGGMQLEQTKVGAEIQRENVKAQNKMSIDERLAQLEAQITTMKAHADIATQNVKAANDATLKQYEMKQAAHVEAAKAEQAFTAPPPDAGDTIHIHLGGPK